MNFILRQATRFIPEEEKHRIIADCLEDPTVRSIVTSAFCCLRVLYDKDALKTASESEIEHAEKLRDSCVQKIMNAADDIPELERYSWLVTESNVLLILKFGMEELIKDDDIDCDDDQNCTWKHLRNEIEDAVTADAPPMYYMYVNQTTY